jgi:predicted ATPase
MRLDDGGLVSADNLSQGTLYLLGMLALAFDPDPPTVLCIEEIDRGIHPRMLREVRDALYRLSYPQAFGLGRHPVQVIATTHSPYLLDLFRDHPEEIVIAQKHGSVARFERLVDRPDVTELLSEGSLGDMWFSGILGGVPEER